MVKEATGRGRPVDGAKQAEQKVKILQAAHSLLSSKSYRSITVRELADHAGINSAMIRYYFGNKEGLFIALLDELSEQQFTDIQAVLASDNPLKEFIASMLIILNENSALARIVHDEVLSDDSPLGDAFIERFPKKMALFLTHLVNSQLNINDLEKAKMLAFNLMSLIVTPFIAAPVRIKAWNIEDSTIENPLWADQIYTLFVSGSKIFSDTSGEQ